MLWNPCVWLNETHSMIEQTCVKKQRLSGRFSLNIFFLHAQRCSWLDMMYALCDDCGYSFAISNPQYGCFAFVYLFIFFSLSLLVFFSCCCLFQSRELCFDKIRSLYIWMAICWDSGHICFGSFHRQNNKRSIAHSAFAKLKCARWVWCSIDGKIRFYPMAIRAPDKVAILYAKYELALWFFAWLPDYKTKLRIKQNFAYWISHSVPSLYSF